MWLRVKKRLSDYNDDSCGQGPSKVVLGTADGTFHVFERCEIAPATKRWCSLSRVHSDRYHGDMLTPSPGFYVDSPSDNNTDASDTTDDYQYYRKLDGADFKGDEELFTVAPTFDDDGYQSSQDSQDSNAENYYTNDYPDQYYSDGDY
jgi:hypothetical protein